MKLESQDTAESNQSLWLVVAAPIIWTGHFLLCYLTAAIWCAKFAEQDASLAPVRSATAIYTLLALAGIASIGRIGYRRHRIADRDPPCDEATRGERHRFLGFATMLLAGLSAIGVIFVALPSIFFHACH